MMSSCHLENTPHAKSRTGDKINTLTHMEYITREGKYATMSHREEDLVYTSSGNLPKWAESAREFWNQAEIHRRKNGRAYREIRIGLQEELSLAENIACIEEFMDKMGIKDHHVYTYAIHDKTAMFDEEHRNIHVHLMFNEKQADYAITESPEQFFKRFTVNADGHSVQGLPVDRYWSTEESTRDMRATWEDIVNRAFERNGLDERISMKTLKAQREALLEEGKYEEAELLNRTPAEHLGNAAKNPKTRERIREMMNELEYDQDEVPVDVVGATTSGDTSYNEHTIQDNTQNIVENEFELKLQIFAHDAVIRKLAKEIQKERKALLQAKETNVEKVEDKAVDSSAKVEEKTANIVTVDDVLVGLEERMMSSLEKQSVLAKQYASEEAKLLPPRETYIATYDAVTNGEYTKHKQAMHDSKMVLKAAERDLKSGLKRVCSYQEFMALTATKEKAREERLRSVRAALACRHEIRMSKELPKQAAIVYEKENAIRDTMKDLQKQIEKENRTYMLYSKKADELLPIPGDTVLFTEAIPREVRKFDKLYGVIPLKDLPSISQNRETKHGKYRDEYIIIDGQIPDRNKPTQVVRAIKVRDAVVDGKAPEYELTITPETSKEGREYFKITSVKETHAQVALHQYRSYKKKDIGDVLHKLKKRTPMKTSELPQPTTRRGYRIHAVNSNTKDFISKSINAIVADGTGGQRQGLWREEEEYKGHVSEMQQVEEKMKQGWSL